MGQSRPLAEKSPALHLVGTWLEQRLPHLDPVATRRFIQITAGIFEAQAALVEKIAASTAFQVPEDCSNYTQVQRILQDLRLTLETVYFPLVQHLLAELHPSSLDLTIDESSHANDFGLFKVGPMSSTVNTPIIRVLMNRLVSQRRIDCCWQ